MKPHILVGTDIGDSIEIIDGAGVYRSGIANHTNRTKAIASVLRNRVFQRGNVNLELLIYRNLPQRIPSQTQ